MPELNDLIRSERLTFIALLETLTDDQWRSPSLCAAWTVENVAAHLAWAPAAGALEMVPTTIRAGFRTNEIIARSAISWTDRGRDAIIDQLRRNVETNAKPVGMPRIAALADAVIHGLDVRVPLGLQSPVKPESFALTADWILDLRWPLTSMVGGSARRRLRGTRLVATDVAWSRGQGVEEPGRTDEILLRLTGRGATRTLSS